MTCTSSSKISAAVISAAALAAFAIGSANASQKRVTLACDGSNAANLSHLVKPKTCSILYPNLPLLGGTQMQHLKWSHWGQPTATATGISHGFHNGPSWRIEVRVTRIRSTRCSAAGGGFWYTRLQVKAAAYKSYSQSFHTDYC